ncbi:MAG: hypothetical protein WC401_07515 [Bacteroidales bacterium]
MINDTEQQHNSSTENKSRLLLETLYDRLNDTTLSKEDLKAFRANVGRSVFEKNKVKKSICEGLFGDEIRRDITVHISPSALTIISYNPEDKFKNKKAWIGISSNEKRNRCHLFSTNSKSEEKTKLEKKDVFIEPSGYIHILNAVETIATQLNLVKQ